MSNEQLIDYLISKKVNVINKGSIKKIGNNYRFQL